MRERENRRERKRESERECLVNKKKYIYNYEKAKYTRHILNVNEETHARRFT